MNKVIINGQQYYRKQLKAPGGGRKNIYGHTVSEVNAKVKEYRKSIEDAQPTSSMTVAEYAAIQLELIKAEVSYRTYVGYEANMRLHIIAPLGEMTLAEVRPDDIRRTLNAVAVQSSSSYHKVHMLLRRIFREARVNRLIEHDPTDGISSKGGKKPKKKVVLTDEQVRTLLDAVGGLKVETFILLGLEAGLRREEILALKWANVEIDTDTPYLRVRHAWRIEHNRPVVNELLKSDAAAREVPIPPLLADHLRSLRDAGADKRSEYVVCGGTGDALSETQSRHLWRQVTRRTTAPHTYVRYQGGRKTVHAVVPKLGDTARNNPKVRYTMDFRVKTHDLRRTYITNLINEGLDPKTVQRLAGHETIQMTMEIYAQVKYNQPEQLYGPVHEAFERLERKFREEELKKS